MGIKDLITTSDLKPCPFCGNVEVDIWASESGAYPGESDVFAGCSRCQFTIGGHLIPELNMEQREEAICRQWNQRYRDYELERLFEKNPTLKESFETFNELYKISTGKEYMETTNKVRRTIKPKTLVEMLTKCNNDNWGGEHEEGLHVAKENIDRFLSLELDLSSAEYSPTNDGQLEIEWKLESVDDYFIMRINKLGAVYLTEHIGGDGEIPFDVLTDLELKEMFEDIIQKVKCYG